MVIVLGEFRLPAERMDEARAMMATVIAATRAEAGCLSYVYAEDVLDPGLIRVSEAWESAEQLAAHLQTPHMAVWATERTGLGLTGRRITRYDAGNPAEL
ncbi:MAG: antibiotic biosynthesis monooxygenase [Sphingomonadales bacterium]|nr:antibiotic biosynthesis monooxygenase [Sphingomonadales bacterium]